MMNPNLYRPTPAIQALLGDNISVCIVCIPAKNGTQVSKGMVHALGEVILEMGGALGQTTQNEIVGYWGGLTRDQRSRLIWHVKKMMFEKNSNLQILFF